MGNISTRKVLKRRSIDKKFKNDSAASSPVFWLDDRTEVQSYHETYWTRSPVRCSTAPASRKYEKFGTVSFQGWTKYFSGAGSLKRWNEPVYLTVDCSSKQCRMYENYWILSKILLNHLPVIMYISIIFHCKVTRRINIFIKKKTMKNSEEHIIASS